MTLIENGRKGAAQLAMGRMAVGLAGFVAPRTFGRLWVGADARSPNVAIITRAFAIRDFALGLGAYLAVQNDAPVRGWVEAGLVSDSADVVATLRGPAPFVKKIGLAGAALFGVVGGVLALQETEPLAV